jgi:hypothetical protein
MFTSSIERRGSRGAQLLEQRAERHAFTQGERLEVGKREAGDGRARRRRRDFAHARDRRRAAGRHADDPQLTGGRRPDHRRAGIGDDGGDANKRGPGAVALAP